jgi:hypothetical protein
VPVAPFAFGAAALIAVLAFAIPFLAFDDDDSGLSSRQRAGLLTEARHWSDIPPLHLQITRVDRVPDTEDGLATGVVTWRTVFGVAYGETHFAEGQASSEWDVERGITAWALLAGVEALLVVVGVRAAMRDL